MNDVLILLQDTVEEMQILVECYNCPQVRGNRNADATSLGSAVREDFCGRVEKQRLKKEKSNGS